MKTLMRWNWLVLLSSSLSLGWIVGCGGVNYQYGSDANAHLPALAQSRALVPDTLDARAGGAPSDAPTVEGADREEELRQVREGVRQHVQNAGLAQSSSIPAPRSPAEVEAILQRAAQQGAQEVIFLRYLSSEYREVCVSSAALAIFIGILPWLIIDSLPISNHGANAMFEAIVVNPAERSVLSRVGRLAAFGEAVSTWGCGGNGIMHEMMRRGMQAVLDGVAQERSQGYPRQVRVSDIGAYVTSAPAVRQEGHRLVGTGWSLDIPAGWSFATDIPGVTAGLRAPDGTTVQLRTETTWSEDVAYGAVSVRQIQLVGGGTVTDQRSATVGPYAALDVDAAFGDGSNTVQRITSAGGIGFILACGNAGRIPAQLRPICEPVFDSFRLEVVSRP